MANVKLTTPIETIELDKEIQKECVMYDACLFDSTPKNFYTCSHCQKIGDKICEKCFINCHQHGNPKKKEKLSEFETKLLTVFDNCCSCALNGHRPEEGENVEPTKEDENCCFEEISRLLKLQYCAIINDETICYGCDKHCYKSAKNAIITDKKLQKCACKKCLEGDKKDIILDIMIQILDNYKEEKYVNTRTFFHLLFMKQELFEIFIRPMLTILKTDKQNLNALDVKILEQIQNNQTGFFPSKKEEDGEEEDEEEEKKGEIEKDNETNQKQENNDDTETERA